MRRVLSLLVLGLIGLLSGPLAADLVVLRDGRTLDTKKPPVIKGRQAVLTLADGKLVSIPAVEIDIEKTAALAKKAAETPKSAEAPPPPRAPSLVDAARATQNSRKAAVVLTDQDVAGGYLEVSSGSPEKGEGEVSIGPTTTKKGEGGYTIEGSVMNSGKAPVLGVSVTIEAVGAEGKSIATTYAALSKDVLDPGEKASFRAQIDTDKTVERFGYVPRWKVIAPPAKEGEPSEGTREREPGETPSEEAPPPPPAPAQEEAPPQRQPDMAAPPANAPVGAPSQPGGTYLPPPSSNQPKPPGGRG
ncbi:MAG: FxLYD domain-containing protein [Thermoanaerobaculia bacterium]